MSPASQGGLQVERYIGTCLISKAEVSAPPSYRYPHGAHGAHGAHAGAPHGAWAGMPLIAMVQPRRNNKPPQQQQQQQQQPAAPPRSPLSRLAIHTQGAPLILAGRYNGSNGRKHGQGGQAGHNAQGGAGHKGGPRGHRPLAAMGVPCGPCGPMALGAHLPASNKQPATASSDSLSVASDESSGHSENSLPRIIKPRKRRKKDRKPPQLGPAADTTASTAAQQQPDPAAPASVPTVSLKSLGEAHADHAAEHADEPKLHHDFDEVKEHEAADEGVLLCQCRYCDPAGLIWDVDQNCYSPFLTPQPQPQHLSSFPLFISDSPRASPRLFLDPPPPPAVCGPVGTPVGTRGPTDLLLRRSWSEPSPSRKHSECSDSQESDRRSPPSHQALEVSSEIVTSHNGHRDIEIKFFSLPAVELDKQ